MKTEWTEFTVTKIAQNDGNICYQIFMNEHCSEFDSQTGITKYSTGHRFIDSFKSKREAIKVAKRLFKNRKSEAEIVFKISDK